LICQPLTARACLHLYSDEARPGDVDRHEINAGHVAAELRRVGAVQIDLGRDE
jgi:hypothetical protein